MGVGHDPPASESAFRGYRSGLGMEGVEGVGAAEEVTQGSPDGGFVVEVGGEDDLAEQLWVGLDFFGVDLDGECLDGAGSWG